MMGWKDLLGDQSTLTYPWVGGRQVVEQVRTWHIEGPLPEEWGWHRFQTSGRTARYLGPGEPQELQREFRVQGYLAGDRLVPYTLLALSTNLQQAIRYWPRVHLLEPVDRFQPIGTSRTWENGPLIYQSLAFPLGPEEDVRRAYEDGLDDIKHIKNVTPALDVAFQAESFIRAEARRRQAELEQRRAEEARRREILRLVGDGEGRRVLAQQDFGAAAAAALRVSGAVYLDHRPLDRGTYAVRFRWINQRFECTVDAQLRVIDSGICLTAHYDDPEFDGGTKGDRWFTLESLPGVIKQADDEDKLVVHRYYDR